MTVSAAVVHRNMLLSAFALTLSLALHHNLDLSPRPCTLTSVLFLLAIAFLKTPNPDFLSSALILPLNLSPQP